MANSTKQVAATNYQTTDLEQIARVLKLPDFKAVTCEHFGQELPADWQCPAECPVKRACFEAFEADHVG